MQLTTEDRLAIHELVARYNHCIDGYDAEAWADTFTPDGVFDSSRSGRYEGRAALVGFVRGISGRAERVRHLTNNAVIDGDGETATMRLYLLRLSSLEGAYSALTGVYRDRLRKVDGAWRFVERKVAVEVPGA